MTCLILGDSIGVGLSEKLPECTRLATVGLSTAGWLHRYGGLNAYAPHDYVVISLGSNDGRVYAMANLRRIRDQVTAKRVIWVLPACNELARRGIEHLAAYNGDSVVSFQPGHDGVHPWSYSLLAHDVKRLAP